MRTTSGEMVIALELSSPVHRTATDQRLRRLQAKNRDQQNRISREWSKLPVATLSENRNVNSEVNSEGARWLASRGAAGRKRKRTVLIRKGSPVPNMATGKRDSRRTRSSQVNERTSRGEEKAMSSEQGSLSGVNEPPAEGLKIHLGGARGADEVEGDGPGP